MVIKKQIPRSLLRGGSLENARLLEQRIEQDSVKRHLERYLSPQLTNSILHSKGDNPLKTLKKNVSVLFGDLRNFTNLCEVMPPELMVEKLNTHFSQMVEVIFSQKGTLDKFVGDMVMCYFNAPEKTEEHEKKTVQTAILMQKALKSINDPWIQEHFHMGIGISSGSSLVGNIGSSIHYDYTVIGDTINLASRLQGVAKGGQILACQTVYEQAKDDFEWKPFGSIGIKGKTKPVEIFEVIYS